MTNIAPITPATPSNMIVGVIVAKLLATVTKRLLNWFERNKYIKKGLATAGLKGSLSSLAAKFV